MLMLDYMQVLISRASVQLQALAPYGLDDASLQRLIMKYQEIPRVVAALQASMGKQAEVVGELGLDFLLG